uniref:BTB domain-containing protein n=1 Tax=Macrostomum lignano TaxID=282301 RepID=A0A1I8F3B9_9PLAT
HQSMVQPAPASIISRAGVAWTPWPTLRPAVVVGLSQLAFPSQPRSLLVTAIWQVGHPNYRRSDPACRPVRCQRGTIGAARDSKRDLMLRILSRIELECQCGQHSDEDGTVKLWLVCNPGQCYRTLHFNKSRLIASLPADVAVETHRLELVSQFDWLYCQYVEFQPFCSRDLAIAELQTLRRVRLPFLDSYHYLFWHIGLLTSNERLLLELRNTPESASLQAYVGHPAAIVRRLMVAKAAGCASAAKGRCRFNNNVDSDDNSSNRHCGSQGKRRRRKRLPLGPPRPAECRCARNPAVKAPRPQQLPVLSPRVRLRCAACGTAGPPWIGAYERHLDGFHGPDSDAVFNAPCRWLASATTRNIDADEWEVSVGGHVIGMSLSQDHRFLFVNVRPWRHPQAAAAAAAVGDAADWDLAFAAAPAAIGALELSESAEIHVLDLLACRYFGCVYTGHKGFTPSQLFCLWMSARNWCAAAARTARGR